jgi:hypothetical protein
LVFSRAFGLVGLDIYAGDPKTNPTLTKVIKYGAATPFTVFKVCGLEYKQGASLAISGFDSFSADVPAKVLYYAQTKVPNNARWIWIIK